MATDRRGDARAGAPDRELLSAADVTRTIARIAHQIIEKTAFGPEHADELVLLGIPTGGAVLARRLAAAIAEFTGVPPAVGSVDPTLYRDDLRRRPARALGDTDGARRRARRPAGRARRRRAVLRADRARRAGRAGRARAPARGAAGRAGRPGPPRAADPRRLRRQERADRSRTSRSSCCSPRSTAGTGSHSLAPTTRQRRRRGPREAPALGDRPRRRGRDGAARHRGPAQAGAAGPRGAQAADAARAHGRHDVLRGLHPHPRLVRDRRQVDERRHVNVSASGSSVGKGESLRDTAATLAAIGADCVVVRHPASGRSAPDGALGGARRGGRAVGPTGPGSATSVVNAGDGTHEHPTQALLDAATLRDRLGGIAGRRIGHRRRRAAQPGRPLERLPARDAGRRGRAGRPAHAAAGRGRGLAVPGGRRPGGRAARAGRGDDAAGAGRADARRVLPVRRGSTRCATGCRSGAPALLPEHAVVLHPGPMVRGMEIAPAVADAPSSAVLAQVRTACTCGWPSSTTCSREPRHERRCRATSRMTGDLLIRGPTPGRMTADADPRAPRRGRAGRRPRPRRGGRGDRDRPVRHRARPSTPVARAAARLRRPAHAPARARRRGVRDRRHGLGRGRARRLHRRLRDAQHRSGRRLRGRRRARARLGEEVGLVDVHPVGAVTVGLGASGWPSWARWPRPGRGCGCSPTTAAACTTPW